MKTTHIRHEEFKDKFLNCSNLGEILKQLEGEFRAINEVICEIRVNGLYLTEEDEVEFSETLLDEIQELNIRTENPQRLIGSTLASLVKLFPQVRSEGVAASELFRVGNDVEKQVKFTKVLEGCQWITDALFLTKQNILDVVKDKAFPEKWKSLEAEFGFTVKQILLAFEKKDFMMVADLLEYDLNNVLGSWEQLINSEWRTLGQHYEISDGDEDGDGEASEKFEDEGFDRNIKGC